MKILILGGTAEARRLAQRLVELGHDVTTSLAGRTQAPAIHPGRLRVGSFGGVPGLAAYLVSAGMDWLVDATHPYAARISANAVQAAHSSGVPLLRLLRPGWSEPEVGRWIHVPDVAAAAAVLPSGARVLLTTGHAGLQEFLGRDDCRFLVRLIERPDFAVPPHAKLVLSRPPYGLAAELALMEGEAITHLVSKNSGGAQTAPKLEAAQLLSTSVIMIARPAYPPAREVAAVDEALAALTG